MFTPKNKDEEMMFLVYKIFRLLREKKDFHYCHLSMLQIQAMITAVSQKKPTMSEIANDLGVKLPTATFLFNRMAEAGYIKRLINKTDRRITKIELTPKGKKTVAHSIKTKMEKMKFVLNQITPEDKKTLFSILKKLYQKLNKNL